MNKRLICAAALVMCVSLTLSGCGSQAAEKISESNIRGQKTTENNIDSEGYELYLENAAVEFYMNPDTTEYYLVNKEDGSFWSSVGTGGGSESSRAVLELSYLESNGSIGKLNSFQNSVADGQYNIESNGEAVSVDYSIGSFSAQVLVPEVISKERYDELCDNLTDEFDRTKFQNYYYFIDPEKVNGEDSDYVKRYPILKSKAMYAVNESVLDSANVKREFAGILEAAGYTEEMYEQDKANFGGVTQENKEAGFNITVEYRLTDKGFTVTVPNEKIEMYNDFPLLNISLNKYFGSPKEGESGYFLLPDGSGSVMNFRNGKGKGHPYSSRVYGTGYALSPNEKTSDYMNSSLPVFGIKRGDSAVFAEITSGDSTAQINAYTGDESEVPYVFAEFIMRETYTSFLSSGKKESSTVVQKQRAVCDFCLSYSFLTGDKADYNGMAQLYRERIFGGSEKITGALLTVDYIGMLEKQAQRLGISYNRKVVMTEFDEVYEITDKLYGDGLTDMAVRLTGWFGGGIAHSSTASLKAEKKLGGEKGFLSLAQKLDEKGIAFYPDADVQYTVSSKTSTAVRMINKSVGKICTFNLASFAKEPEQIERLINNSGTIAKETDSLLTYANKNNLSALSVRSIGSDLNADFNESNPCTQDKAVKEMTGIAKKLSANADIMTNGANAYVLPYIKAAAEIPLSSNGYDITDYSVPFLQQVTHGYISLYGSALNLAGDPNDIILRSARTGTGLYLRLSAKNADGIIDSDYEKLYSTDYNSVINSVGDKLKRYQSELSCTLGQTISSFEYLADGVSQTIYENGVRVIVNTGDTAYSFGGITVGSKDYTVARGERV